MNEYGQRRSSYKSLYALLSLMLITFAFAGCDKKQPPSGVEGTTKPVPPAVKPASLPQKGDIKKELVAKIAVSDVDTVLADEANILALYKHEMLDLTGDMINEIMKDEEGEAFLNIVLNNSTILTDFLNSGLFNGITNDYTKDNTDASPNAPLALKNFFEIYKSDKSCLDNEIYRKMAMGFALSQAYAGGTSDGHIKIYSRYKGYHQKDALHRMVNDYDVWEMRYLAGGHYIAEDSHEWMINNVNVPVQELAKGYFGACWIVRYRSNNEFGRHIQRQGYHDPWIANMSWAESVYRNGGVCGALSTFGTIVAKARGIPAVTVGSSTHCAYAVRFKRGLWVSGFGGGTSVGASRLQYGAQMNINALYLMEEVMGDNEKLLKSNQQLMISHLYDDYATINKHIEKAIEYQPLNLKAWDAAIRARITQELSAKDWWSFTTTLADKTQKYPEMLSMFFKGYQTFAGLTGVDYELAFWELSLSSLTKHAYWHHDVERKARGRNTALITQGATRVRFGHAFNNIIEIVGDDNVDKVFQSTFAAFRANTPAKFDINQWGLSHLNKNTALKRKWLHATLKNVGEMTPEALNGYYSKIISDAAKHDDFKFFNQVTEKAEEYYSDKEKTRLQENAANLPELTLPVVEGRLVSKGALARPHSSDRSDTPLLHGKLLTKDGGYIHARKSKNPYVLLRLPKLSEVARIVVVNNFGENVDRSTPLDVSVSTAGKSWDKIGSVTESGGVWDINLENAKSQAIFVRISRNHKDKTPLILRKVLVYGRYLE